MSLSTTLVPSANSEVSLVPVMRPAVQTVSLEAKVSMVVSAMIVSELVPVHTSTHLMLLNFRSSLRLYSLSTIFSPTRSVCVLVPVESVRSSRFLVFLSFVHEIDRYIYIIDAMVYSAEEVGGLNTPKTPPFVGKLEKSWISQPLW